MTAGFLSWSGVFSLFYLYFYSSKAPEYLFRHCWCHVTSNKRPSDTIYNKKCDQPLFEKITELAHLVLDFLHVKGSVFFVFFNDLSHVLSYQVCKVQHGERSGGANAVQSFRDQVRCHGVWTGGFFSPPVYFLWFVCMFGILKCLAVTMKENVTNKWSDSLICCPGGKVQLHPAHHLHRINAVILRSSKRPPCFLVSIHAFVLWTLNTDHHCVPSGCIWVNWITIKSWLSWICEMKATGGKFGVKIKIKKNFGCSRKEVRCLRIVLKIQFHFGLWSKWSPVVGCN